MDSTALSFAIYTLAIMLLGVWSARSVQKSQAGNSPPATAETASENYFLAGRGLGPWVAALSASASAESGWVTLGLVGVAYTTGVGVCWLVFGTVAAFLFNWVCIAPKLRLSSGETRSLTLPDVLSAGTTGWLGQAIRGAAALIIVCMLTAYVAAQLNAAGKAFQETFGWHYVLGVLVGSGIVLVYTLIGGFRAVAVTDVVQACLMITAVILLPIVMISQLGGLGELLTQLASLEAQQIEVHDKSVGLAAGSTMTSPWAGKSGWAIVGFLSVWLGIPLGNAGQPHLLVRLMATRDQTAIRRATIISSIWVFVLFSGAILVGLCARVMFGESLIDPERALPHAALELLPGPLAGLIIAAIVAAMCSTADSQLLVSASAISHDIWTKLFRQSATGKRMSMINRGTVLVVSVVATVIAITEVRGVFDFVLYAWDGLGAAFGPALVFKLFWPKTSGAGVLAGILVGFLTAVIWRETLHAQFYSLIPAMTLATLAIVAASLSFPNAIRAE